MTVPDAGVVDAGVVDAAVLLLRVVVGLTMVAHGYNHLWGPGGLTGTARWFASMGLRPPKLHAVLSGAGELAAGAALAIGLLTALAAAFIVGTMVVAGVTAHRRNGFFVFKEGYEYVLLIAVVCAVIGLLGPGAVSADRLLGTERLLGIGGMGLGFTVGLGVLGAAVLLAVTWRPARPVRG
ncbi:MAG: DoxX family protein [Pseudonocardiaceae bacterium]